MLREQGPFQYGWSAFGTLGPGQGLCFPSRSLTIGKIEDRRDHIRGSSLFKAIKPGDLLLILGNTFHGGSAHSSVESRSRSRLLHDLDDLKFFINCPGLNDPTNPNNGY